MTSLSPIKRTRALPSSSAVVSVSETIHTWENAWMIFTVKLVCHVTLIILDSEHCTKWDLSPTLNSPLDRWRQHLLAAVSQAKGEKNRRQMRSSLLWSSLSSFVCNLSTRWKRKERKLCQFSAWWWKRCGAVQSRKKLRSRTSRSFHLLGCLVSLSLNSLATQLFIFFLCESKIARHSSLHYVRMILSTCSLFSPWSMWWIAADVLFDLGWLGLIYLVFYIVEFLQSQPQDVLALIFLACYADDGDFFVT